MKYWFLLWIGLAGATLGAQPGPVAFYVSPAGKPGNPGTEKKPFVTLENARDAIRRRRAKDPAPRRYTVFLRSGTYFRRTPFELTAADSGTLEYPVRYAAFPGDSVVLHGGQYLQPAQFQPATDPKILDRLLPEMRGSILALDLRAAGVTDFGTLRQHGFGRVAEPAPLELFIGGERQPLARYPNFGMLAIGKVFDPGSIPRQGDFSGRGATFGYESDRPRRWLQAADIWLHGHFSFGYNDDHLRVTKIDTAQKTLTLAQPHVYGVKSGLYVDTTKWEETAGRSLRGYYVYNLPEELDRPGEWYLDRQTGILYLCPPEGFDPAAVEVSLLEQPFFRLLNTAHLLFENIDFRTARGMGIYLENAHHIDIDHCSFSQLGTVAISAGQPLQNNLQTYSPDGAPLLDDWRSEQFHHIRIRHCRIFRTGAGGVILTGGDRRQLLPAENLISHCAFFQTDQINHTFAAAVKLAGVGSTVRNCSFHDLKHMAVGFTGNDHRIQSNRFERVCTRADDMGAIYTGRDPSARGTVIRHNHFRDILPADRESQVGAVFLDDGAGGISVDSNFFERVGSQGDKELFGAVFLHGGHGNSVNHNVFLDCEVALGNNFWTEKQWQSFLESPLIQQRLRQQVDIASAVYLEKYPELNDYFNAYGPRLNRIVENILIRSNMALNGRLELVFNHLYAPERLEKALERIGFRMDRVGPEH